MMQLDFACNATRSDDATEADPSLGSSLVAVDRQTGFLYGNALGSKGADGLTVQEIDTFVKMMGYQQVEIRCDNEPAVVSIEKGVLDARSRTGDKTICSTGKKRDSKSMGLVETKYTTLAC